MRSDLYKRCIRRFCLAQGFEHATAMSKLNDTLHIPLGYEANKP